MIETIKVVEICPMPLQQSTYNLNGKFFTASEKIFGADNRSFRYGDGFFETIKMVDGKLPLQQLHFDRITNSMETLKFTLAKKFSFSKLEQEILEVATKNHHHAFGRIRITFFRNDGGLYEVQHHQPNILIQSFELGAAHNHLNENGLVIDVYPTARKACDIFSNVKSNNYLPYTMAALWAKENKLNDALVLNSNNNIADSTIANIFIVKDGIVKTPALTEGCVSGVMRKHLIARLKQHNMPVEETTISVAEVLNADEVFLTNAIKGIQWVQYCGEKQFADSVTKQVAKWVQ